jgi:hypothetical protein
LFNTGDVLTAAQVNTYLNEQTVMVFASSAARTSALSGVLAEGMMSYLQDTNSVEVYNGSSWVNVGNAGDITEVQAGVGISIASGTGPIPVISNSSTDLITTAGDLLYGTAADTVARLGIGTAGQVLKVNSGATAPEWGSAAAAGGMTLLSTTTLSSTAVTLSGISQDYENLFVEVYGVTNNTADTQMRFGLNSNMTAFARGTRSFIAGTSQTIEYSNGLVSVNNMKRTGGANTFNLYITDYKNTSNYKQLFAVYYYDGTSALQNQMDILYYVTNTNAITSVTFDNNGSQTFTAGTMRLWGIK